MKIKKDTNILIVGLGLIGGSYARGLTKKGYKVNAITKKQSSIDYAIENRFIENGTIKVDKEMICKADIVIFALYPHVFYEWIEKYQKHLKPNSIITDVTGVKGCIVDKIQAILRDDVEFISAHPMAGRETLGVENSDERIFKNANYIVTPTKMNTEYAIELCKELGNILGFKTISVLSIKEHDEMIGFVSQLTHCIAVTLMTCNDSKHLENYTGDSFRDLTRIAKIDDKMWSELFLLNKDALLGQMQIFENQLDTLKELLKAEDKEGLQELMKRSTKRRALFDKKD